MHSGRTLFVLLIATGCSTANRTSPAPAVVNIEATDYAFAAPDSIAAGLTTFRMVNAGREPHQAVVAGSPEKKRLPSSKPRCSAKARFPNG